MTKYVTIKKGIQLATDNGRKILIYTNYKDIDEEDFLKKYKVNIVTIVNDFIEENLSNILSVKSLNIRDCDFTSFNPQSFYQLKSLLRLDLIDSEVPRTIQFEHMEKLEELELNWHKSYNFSNCKTLLEVVIRKINSEDLTHITNLPSLEKLEVIQGKLKNLNGIEDFKNLKAVTFFKSKGFTELDPLTKLNELEYLYLNNYPSLIDLNQFIRLKKLKWLVFENCPNIFSVNALESMPSLIGVIINGKNKFSDDEKKIIKKFNQTRFFYFRVNHVRERLK